MDVNVEAFVNGVRVWWISLPFEGKIIIVGSVLLALLMLWAVRRMQRTAPGFVFPSAVKGELKANHTIVMTDLDGMTLNVNHDGLPDYPDNITITVKHEYPDNGEDDEPEDDAEQYDLEPADMQKLMSMMSVHQSALQAELNEDNREPFLRAARHMRDDLTNFLRTYTA